jgi:hypothetical protein
MTSAETSSPSHPKREIVCRQLINRLRKEPPACPSLRAGMMILTSHPPPDSSGGELLTGPTGMVEDRFSLNSASFCARRASVPRDCTCLSRVACPSGGAVEASRKCAASKRGNRIRRPGQSSIKETRSIAAEHYRRVAPFLPLSSLRTTRVPTLVLSVLGAKVNTLTRQCEIRFRGV